MQTLTLIGNGRALGRGLFASEVSDIEQKVICSVSEGKSNREIGREFGLSELTIKQHLARISKRLGCEGREQIAQIAFDQGWATRKTIADESKISERERQILNLAAEGWSNAQIAYILDLSPHTVKTHIRNVLGKLRISSRVHLVAYAELPTY